MDTRVILNFIRSRATRTNWKAAAKLFYWDCIDFIRMLADVGKVYTYDSKTHFVRKYFLYFVRTSIDFTYEFLVFNLSLLFLTSSSYVDCVGCALNCLYLAFLEPDL